MEKIRLEIIGMSYSQSQSGAYALILGEVSGKRRLPIIIGGLGSRGVVSSCSYEARRFGVHSAMPVKMARRLCPQATFLRGDMDEYTKYSRWQYYIIYGK